MTTCIEEGDTIAGDVLVGEARNISKPQVIVRTGKHKAKRIILRDNARCRIEKKLRFISYYYILIRVNLCLKNPWKMIPFW